MNEKEIFMIKSYCIHNLNLSSAKLSNEFYYDSLAFCIIDAIFSIGAKYSSTRKTVQRYCNYYNLQRIRTTKEFSLSAEQHKTSDLINNINHVGVSYFAEKILCNRQRTSTKNGILKAEAVYSWTEILKNFGIETLQDFNNCINDNLKNDLSKIKGQGSGISITYLCMLCGNENFAKPDRHILNFLSNILGYTVDTYQAQSILRNITNTLKNELPNINIRLLDHTIWSYMSTHK